MKNLITYLKTLWSWVADSQSTDVSLDCRLTVGSPSFDCRSAMLKFVSVLVLILTVGVGNVWGADTELTFSLTSNPGGWPTTNSTTLTNYTYTLSGTNYTFALKNVKQNSGYLMLTSTAVLGLPAISGMTLTKVVVSNSSGCSTSTSVGISSSSSSASYISGGAYQTYSTTSSTYTYNLTGTSANTMYYLYVTNKNCQITQLKLTYSGGSTPSLTASPTSLDWGSVAKGTSLSTKTFSISGSNLTSGSLSITASSGWSVSPTSKSVSGTLDPTTVTVTPPSTSTAGTKNGTITISGGGLASSVVVNLSLTVNEVDNFIDVVQSTSGYTEGSPHQETGSYSTPTLTDKSVATSGTCEELHYHFVGWITKTKYDAGTSIAVGDLQTPTSATGTTYYAVWAKQAAGGSSNSISLTYTDFGYTSTTYSTKSVTKGGFTFTCKQGCRSNSPYSLQMNSTKTGHLYNTTAIAGLQSVTLKCNDKNTGKTATIYQGASQEPTSSSAGTAACAASKNYTINITSGSYFTIAVSGATYFSEVVITYSTITYEDYIAKCCDDPGLAYATGSVTKTYGEGAFTNALTNSHSVGVTYALSSVSPAGCVSINASTGQVTINGAGSATVTASFAGNATYCADEASYTLTVNKANISPTLTYSPNSVAVGENSATPSVGGNSGSGTVTYAITSASPAGCATINTSTGVVTGLAVGSVTVTATVGATANYNGNTATATVTITAASNFPNNKTIFIQAHSTSAWTGGGCVKAWFHTAGGSEAAQSTYWLFDAGYPDEGKKLFAAIVPSTGNLPYLDIQRFAANCSDWWNKNGGCSYSDADGSNAIRSTGKHDDSSEGDYVRWNDDAVTLSLYGDPNSWGSSLASFSDQGNGVWTATYNNYAPANAAGESQDFKICTNYNGWIGNTGSNNNVTVSDMHVGSTYNIGASLDIKDHSLTLTKTFVKGTVHFNMKGHGSAISDLTNVAAGSKISAPSPAPTAAGYRFVGWYKEDACTNAWNFGSDVVNETMTLYAKWVQTFTVAYNNNGGSGSMTDSNSPYDSGATVTVKSNSFTAPTGKEFNHWDTKDDDTGTDYAPAATFTISANTTLYAQWSFVNYNVTYSAPSNGNYTIKVADGTASSATKTANYNQTITIAATPSANYRFGSWTIRNTSTSADVTSTLLTGDKPTTASTTFTMPAYGVTVTASFVRVYTVTFVHHDKGTYSGASTEVLVPANANTITLPTVTSVSCGFYDTFEGWIASGSEYSESTSKPATVYAGGSSYTVTDDITLRALYSKCEGAGGQSYHKVTAIGDVTDGTYILVSNASTPTVYSGHSGSNTYGDCVTGLTADGDDYSSTLPSGAVQVTVTRGTGGNASKFTIHNGSKYIVAGTESTGTSDSESWWQLTTGSNVNSKACPAGVIQPASYTDNVLQENNTYYRFRTYKNSQTAYVFLYKLIDKCTKYYATNPSCVKPVGVHITYNKNAGDATMSCSTSNKTYKVVDAVNQYPKLASAYTFCDNATRPGYTLVGWNTQANGLGTTYELDHSYSNLPVSGDLDGENWVTLTVYAMWAPSVSFNVGNAAGGTGVPDVIEADGGFMLPTPTAAQLGTIPCGYSFYGWSESSVAATTTKPTLYMPGTKYTGSYRTLYAVYRLAGDGGNPDLFSLSYMVSSTKYYVAAPSGITTAPSTWNNDKAAKFTASTNAEDAVAFGMKTNSEYTSYKEIYWVYDGDEDEKAYLSHSNGANITFKNEEDTYYHKWTVTGSTELTFLYTDGRYLSGTTTEIGCPSDVGVSTFTKEEASTTSYTYATNPSCETTATLAFVTNGGTLNYPTAYDASNYVDLTVGTSVYLPTATYPGEWTFEGWMKGSAVTSTDLRPESANFYTVTLNTTTYSAAPAGTTTFYAVYSKTVNDKQFDPVNGGTYKLFAIMSDGTTKKYMPVWDGTQTTLTPVTSCASTGDYTITPGTGVHAGQYQITHGSYTLGVRDDANTQFKNVADTWWNIEASTSGKGTYRITVVGSSNRCLSHGGTGFFGNYTRNDVNNPSQPGYRDMEIGECIYTEYTSTPENIPYITITGNPVKITSTNGERVYSPTKLHIEAHNFTGTRRINFSATNGFATNPTYVNCLADGSYSGDIDIYYEPTSDGTGNIVSSVLTASQAAESVTQTFAAIQGRNMPANFVIAVKSGTQWYALPDDCHSSGTPKAVAIEVNDPSAPTAATLVPHNTEWRLSDVVNSNSRPKDKVYFYEPNSTNDYTLYAGSAPNIQTNAQLSNVTGENSYTYEWGLATNDLCAYTICNANVNKNISIDTKGTFGTHATNIVSSTLYLLPITAYYEPAEFQVVEWKANSVVVMYLGSATKASVQVGGNDEGGNQTLSDVKVDHGVFELAASGLTSAAFESLQIVFKNNGGTEIGRNYVAIPAIISGEVLTSAYESQKDLAESNDVVILKNGKLTTTGTGTDGTSYKFTNVTVYGGGKLDIASGTKLGVTGSLILRAGGVSSGSYEYIYPQMNLGGTLTNTSGKFYYEYVTDYSHWYHYVLPFDALTSTIKYPTEYYGSAVTAANHGSWIIKRYDGATRATGEYNAWVDIESSGEPTPTTVSAGHGYIFWGAPKKVTANGVQDRQAWGIQRIAMSKAAGDAKTAENANKTVTGLGSYSGVSGNSGKNNDQGWNLIGNPYMVNLTGLNSTSVQVGQLVHTDTDPWDGKWEWDNTDPDAGGLRYVTIPDDHFDNYEAKTMSWFTAENPMKTGRTFFVQIAGANTSVAFAAANRASLMPAWRHSVQSEAVDIETGIVMTDENHSDEVNFWIKDGKTAEYEYNADYPKTPNSSNFNIYGVHSHGDLSWIAISPEIAEGSMAIGYQVPAAGDYTLSLSETYVSDKIDQLLVTDHVMSPEITTNLLAEDYIFHVNQAETNNERFTVTIKIKSKTDIMTDINDIRTDSEQPLKFIYHEKMYILRGGKVYDTTGKMVQINK